MGARMACPSPATSVGHSVPCLKRSGFMARLIYLSSNLCSVIPLAALHMSKREVITTADMNCHYLLVYLLLLPLLPYPYHMPAMSKLLITTT